ncbi:hypothetical protein Patl1_00712 [Pistacia atlantica]|uniref:Uncharacterized protein n=1 Tax=Pistacia atlantica TaxID=434234 RepID=A0ACC1CBK7_9ROSI|nr:hypothetical protein Patl1_00712 [Pistacia atlantica]
MLDYSFLLKVNRELPMELDMHMLDSSDELNEDDFSILQSFLHPEQGSSPSNGSNNEFNVRSSQLDMSDQDDEFVNSLLSTDFQLYEETIHTRPHGCNPTKPLRGVYVGDSSDSDTETLQAQYGDAGLKEYQQMQKIRASTETLPSLNLQTRASTETLPSLKPQTRVYTQTRPSPKLRRNENGEYGLFHDEMLASTANSKTDMPKRINLVHSDLPTNTRAWKAQPQPKSHNLVERECAPKILQLNGEGSRTVYRDRAREVKEPAINLPQKGNPTAKLDKDRKMPETTKAETNLKSRSTTSDRSNRKGSFIVMETSPLDHEQIPPSIYIRNIAVGIVLSVFCIWEMASLH